MAMEARSADKKSAFDRFFASSEGQKELYARLEKARVAREEATPSPCFSDHGSLEEDFRWQCDTLQGEFVGREMENVRLGITHRDYWETECHHYANAIQQLLLRSSNKEENAKKPTSQQWRTAALRYRHIMQLYGVSLDEVDQIRHSISNQKYWTEELEVLQQRIALREHEAYEAYWRKKDDIQRRRNERVKLCLQAIGESSPSRPMRSSPKRALRQDGSVASRTRSKMKIGGMLKR